MIIRTIDLFSGIGGIRLGFDQACCEAGIYHECVFASDISRNACKVYRHRFGSCPDPYRDITLDSVRERIPDFDILLAGFPCQAFSIAGEQGGFEDSRGNLFFEVAKVLKKKTPSAFMLENVKGLLTHDKGKTFRVIFSTLDSLGYHVFYHILNSKDFGVPQNRPRIYIAGFLKGKFGGRFSFPLGNDNSKRLSDVLLPDPVDEKYYISKPYWDTLLRHKQRHQDKKHGFGYEIKTPDDIANTILCGGMGKERNIIRNTSQLPLPEWANVDRVRFMSPVEWERLQGFPDGWSEAVPPSSRMSLLGNSVTVPVIKAVSSRIITELCNPIAVMDSIFGEQESYV